MSKRNHFLADGLLTLGILLGVFLISLCLQILYQKQTLTTQCH